MVKYVIFFKSLEKQLKLNNSTFSCQLANENKKAVETGIITKNLQMEIKSLHQKIKVFKILNRFLFLQENSSV